jgi:hypothetical protein
MSKTVAVPGFLHDNHATVHSDKVLRFWTLETVLKQRRQYSSDLLAIHMRFEWIGRITSAGFDIDGFRESRD